MRYEVYAKAGFVGVARSYRAARKLFPAVGPFAVLEKATRNAYPHAGHSGRDGVTYRSTMLLYPPNAKCEQWSPERYLQDAGVTK